MRTVDIARETGYSVQQVRNLERDGVLPPAGRTPTGYRIYAEPHLHSALAYRALAAGTGPVEAKRILRATHGRPTSEVLALLDAAHARLDSERRELNLAKEAAEAIAAERIDGVRPSDSMSITELATALGVRPSTLRHWDAEGLVVPRRDSAREPRRYSPDLVRDARIVHQLRMAGYRIAPLKSLMPQLQRSHRWAEVMTTLATRDASIDARSRALLQGAAALSAVLDAQLPIGRCSLNIPSAPWPGVAVDTRWTSAFGLGLVGCTSAVHRQELVAVTNDPSLPGLQSSPEIDTTVSHSARIWNYWLGGRDNYPVDRDAGDRIAEVLPEIVTHARANRMFLGRAVRFFAGEAGVRQFLDIGAGLPTVDNTHEVAQRIAPESKIVYIDNDPLVLVHAHALLTSTSEGVTDYINADLREPEHVLEGAKRTLDFTRPIAITMLGVLWHIVDDDEAHPIIHRLIDELAPGSYLALAHPTIEVTGERMERAIQYWNEYGTPPGCHRTPRQIASFFERLELVEPGVVASTRWRPEATPFGLPEPIDQFCGVGRKP